MDETYETKKYEADKLALLGLFAVGLLIARFITSSRSTRPSKAGREVVAEIKRKGIYSFLNEQDRQSFFLIKNMTGHTIGFTMDVFGNSAPDAKLNIQSAGLLYTRGKYGQEQLTLLQSDDSFDEFSWKTETTSPTGRSRTEILLEKDGVLTVTRLARTKRTQKYKPGPASIPDFLLDLVFTQMLESNHRKIIVDTINTDGSLGKVVISKMKNKLPGPPKAEPAYKLKVQFLGDRRFSQEVHLDSRGHISKIWQDDTYRLERTNAENILKLFPERADYILQKNKLPEPNKP
jgi:hypothetical protein